MKTMGRLMVAAGLLLFAGTSAAQTTTKSVEVGKPEYTVDQITGTVVAVDGNSLLAKMAPSGNYRWFDVIPSRQFIIDGQPKAISQLVPGTVLTATVVTKTLPVNVRTITITKGTVLSVYGRHLTVRLENGERHSYNVPENFMFNVEGKQVSLDQLQKGMSLTGTKIVDDPTSEFSSLTVITGKAPK